MATTLGPWPLGIDNVNPDTDLPEGALRVADDVLIDLNGSVNSGPGARLLSALDGLRALWTSKTGASYAFLGEAVARVDLAGVTPLANVGATNKGAFADHLDWVVTCSGGGLHRIRGDQVEPIALPYPAFTVRAGTAGGLDAGRYGVALATLRDGEEYALSPISFVNVAQGGGLVLNISGSSQVRIYRTGANGDQLYRAVDAPAGLPDYLIGAGLLGSLPSSQYLEPLPGGQLIASWNGRLLVARGRTLNFSQALRPALYDPATTFCSCQRDSACWPQWVTGFTWPTALAPGSPMAPARISGCCAGSRQALRQRVASRCCLAGFSRRSQTCLWPSGSPTPVLYWGCPRGRSFSRRQKGSG